MRMCIQATKWPFVRPITAKIPGNEADLCSLDAHTPSIFPHVPHVTPGHLFCTPTIAALTQAPIHPRSSLHVRSCSRGAALGGAAARPLCTATPTPVHAWQPLSSDDAVGAPCPSTWRLRLLLLPLPPALEVVLGSLEPRIDAVDVL